MCEVTLANFDGVVDELSAVINKAKFVTIDCEFSALNISNRLKLSLFDTAEARYNKTKLLCEQIIPVQIGISAFIFNPDNNSYLSHSYTFYTFPRGFFCINPKFTCQSSSLQFLCHYNFNFNKFIYNGIPYLNRSQENELRDFVQNQKYQQERTEDDNEIENLMSKYNPDITKWIVSSKEGDTFPLPGVYEIYKTSFAVGYVVLKRFRRKYNKRIWSFVENEQVFIKRVSHKEYDELERSSKIDEFHLNKMLGFTRIFRILVESKKPLVGHNLYTDLMLMYQCFENPLPKSYAEFKKELHGLFPEIYDTKTLTFHLQNLLTDGGNRHKALWGRNMLSELYDYFKDGAGRHLAMNSPLIEMKDAPATDNFHDAGWDSYCTGYIFVRMAHALASLKHGGKMEFKQFMFAELLAAVADEKNKVNLIRCNVAYMKVDGNDPASRRPPLLIVLPLKSKTVDLREVSLMMSSCGYAEIKQYYGNSRALVAVDNFGSVRRIFNLFRENKEYKVRTFSLTQHSPVVRAMLWGGLITSSALFICLVACVK